MKRKLSKIILDFLVILGVLCLVLLFSGCSTTCNTPTTTLPKLVLLKGKKYEVQIPEKKKVKIISQNGNTITLKKKDLIQSSLISQQLRIAAKKEKKIILFYEKEIKKYLEFREKMKNKNRENSR